MIKVTPEFVEDYKRKFVTHEEPYRLGLLASEKYLREHIASLFLYTLDFRKALGIRLSYIQLDSRFPSASSGWLVNIFKFCNELEMELYIKQSPRVPTTNYVEARCIQK